jgi:hypothetical protein
MQPRKRRVNHKKMCEMPSPFAHHKMETQAPQPSASLTHAPAHIHARARNQSLTSRTSAITSIMSLFRLHVYKFSPLPSQGRGQGEGLVCSGAAAGIPHLNPRPQARGETANPSKRVDTRSRPRQRSQFDYNLRRCFEPGTARSTDSISF